MSFVLRENPLSNPSIEFIQIIVNDSKLSAGKKTEIRSKSCKIINRVFMYI